MLYSFRWFGHNDPSQLDQIRQIGVEGIVSSLAQIKYGDKWSSIEIKKKKRPPHAPECVRGRIHTNSVCVITTTNLVSLI